MGDIKRQWERGTEQTEKNKVKKLKRGRKKNCVIIECAEKCN